MPELKTTYHKDRRSWRSWLAKNSLHEQEIWLIFYKKHVDKPCVTYNEAVEEALCYGWIDSIIRRLDHDRYIQKFTPRRPGSKWSQSNLDRMKRLLVSGRVTKAGLALYENRNLERPAAEKIRMAGRGVPALLKAALQRNKTARRNWDTFAPGSRRRYIAWIVSAKKEGTRERRTREAVALIAKNVRNLLK